jgi:hypothetical protein
VYYALFRAPTSHRWIGDEPFVKGIKWNRGVKITTQVPRPLPYILQPLNPQSSDDSPYMPAYLNARGLLFRDDLIQALHDCGVDNFDAYEVVITDPDNGAVYTNYKMLNLIGLVSAADMSASQATLHDNVPLIDVDFDRLVVDESKTRGALMFRLAESTNGVLVHHRLRDCLLAKGFGHDLAFYDPREVAL